MNNNITLRLDARTLERIKHIAVDRNTSVSAWVGDLVTRAVDKLDGFELARARNAGDERTRSGAGCQFAWARRVPCALKSLSIPTSLYYANTQSADPRHAEARESVRDLWCELGRAAISAQVLQELHINLLRKAKLTVAESVQQVSNYPAWRVIDNDRALLAAGFDVQARWKLGLWDSLIVAAALRSGVSELWTGALPAGYPAGGQPMRPAGTSAGGPA